MVLICWIEPLIDPKNTKSIRLSYSYLLLEIEEIVYL